MALARAHIVQYLLAHGFISEGALLENNVTLVEASRRNANIKVTQLLGPSYLIKQGVDADTRQTLAHEAAIYTYVAALPADCELRRCFVQCHAHDASEHLLILELVPDAQTLRERHATTGRFSRQLAGELGRTLAACHLAPCPRGKSPERSSPGVQFPMELPWALSLHRPSLHQLCRLSHAQIDLLKLVQRYPEYCVALDTLHIGWRRDTLIHNDLRWGNVLVVPAKAGRPPDLKLIDWELADIGDACWDLGAAFSEYLSSWVFSMPVTGALPAEEMMGLARYPIDIMLPAIRALWAAYRTGMKLSGREAEEVLNRAVRYAGARLLQTAHEHLYRANAMTGHAVILLQLSANILQAPEEATLHLLDIPFERR